MKRPLEGGLAACGVRGALLVLVLLLAGLTGCAGYRPGQLPVVDIAILTVLDPEYAALLGRVDAATVVEGPEARRYRWVSGEIRSNQHGRPYRVVLGMAFDKGEVAGALATQAMISRFGPDTLLLVGIAGGIDGAAAVGDIVLPDPIWPYEIGHLGDQFTPRLGSIYTPDPNLLRAAQGLGPAWIQGIRAEAPDPTPAPRVVSGPIASGNKVIESKGSSLYQALVRAQPGIIAVEMEASGAAAAVAGAKGPGEVGFMMVRAVSDVIRASPEGAVVEGADYVDPERERWRDYAADVAAAFAVELIRSGWPFPPR